MDVMHVLISSWSNVTATTISNCFRKASFFHYAKIIPLHEIEDNSNDFNIDEEEWNSLSQKSFFLGICQCWWKISIRDIKTVFYDATAEKKDDNDEIVIVSVPSYATVLILDSLRCCLLNADVA